ncbi:MAG: hypothetical protein KF682_21885 [Nitrospira sp.]|nr:hypothetical protein [Nitrospira sp.]
MPAPSTPQTIPDVTEDSETGSGLGKSRDNGIFDQIRADGAVYFCFGSIAAGCLRQHLSDHVSVSAQFLLLHSCTHCATGDNARREALLVVPSIPRPAPIVA